jgi:putative DNA primase/helicase
MSDARRIKQMLRERVIELAQYLYPNGYREGAHWCVGSIEGEPGKSFKICIAGPKAGLWGDFADSGKHSTNLLNLWMLARNVDFKTGMRQAAEWLGERLNRPNNTAQPASTKRRSTLTFLNLLEAISYTARKLNKRFTRHDWYHHPKGNKHFVVVRFDDNTEKDFRPYHRNTSGWVIADPPGKLPLFHLPELLARQREQVFVVEGEKCTCDLTTLGLLVTTSAHGAKAADKTDWQPLAGREVVILPDNDVEGRAYAQIVAGILKRLSPPAVVKIVELPDLPPKGDCVDWLDARDAQTPEDITDELLAMVKNADEIQTTAEIGSYSVAQWFAQRFPKLPDEFGDAVLEEPDNTGRLLVSDICEPFLAATLGDHGTPDAPTVYLPAENRFWTYSPDEGVFIEARDPSLLTRLSSLLLQAARACDGAVTKKLKFRFRDSSNLVGVIKHAQGLLAKPHDYFNSGLTQFILCRNGMLRLSDKELLAFSPSYCRRNKLAVAFDPAAKCPLFLDTLMRPALDTEELDLLQRWCGLTLIGENIAQIILLLTGTAGGGKGTFIRVLVGIIGSRNVGALRTQLLCERFELGRFLGRTLLYGADVPDDFLNHRGASILKALTGGDPVTLEFKNSNEAPSIVCKFNVVVTCNSRLTVHLEGDTGAWRRRLAPIEYRNPKPEKVIADLSEQILAREASGVLNWMLEGLEKIRADDWQLHLTAAQQKVVDDLLLESESHIVFVGESLVRAAEEQLTVTDCYSRYVEFCNEHGWRALTRNKFGTVIGDAVVYQFGITPRHDIRDGNGKPQRGWKGIRWN